MLVLTRKLFERILIRSGDDTITVSVQRIGPTEIRLGIEAPQHFAIVRSELVEKDPWREARRERRV